MGFSLKKALLVSAFFIGQIFSISWANDGCHLPAPWYSTKLIKVLDGDTLLLAKSEKVRLIGVNTPELATQKKTAEPFAKQATQAATKFFNNKSVIKLKYGSQSKDHYGRTLAYVARADSKLLSEFLVSQGLAFYLAIPPNLDLLPCLITKERQARLNKVGLWKSYQPVTAKKIKQAGFSLVTGKVEKVSQASNGVWVDLAGQLVLFIPQSNKKKYFSRNALDQMQGHLVEVRGWLIDRREHGRKLKKGRKRWMMKIFHPAAIKVK